MNQSGIRASTDLLTLFAHAVNDASTRAIRVSIEDESLVPDGTSPVQGDWEDDFHVIQEYLDPKKPCYVLYRLDSRGGSGDYDWLFNCYVPDHAHIREKMLYASTRATLVRDLADYRFKDSVYGTTVAEFTREGYAKHCAHQSSPAPLTEREKEMEEIKKTEHRSDIGTETRHSHVSAFNFPVAESATDALTKLRDGEVNTVILHIDIAPGESIALDAAENFHTADEVGSRLPRDFPRFVFRQLDPLLLQADSVPKETGTASFLYSCPTKSKIRERMLYSSCRPAALRAAESVLGYSIKYRFELDDPSEFTDEYVRVKLAPAGSAALSRDSSASPNNGSPESQRFRKPAPPGRGPSRLNRTQNAPPGDP